jgi:AcrR family transcriptional regulator
MEHQTIDPRTRKTKRAIRNAFAKLLSEKEIDEITIRDISELAEINRKTFYRYYGGIYQVVDEIENEVVSAFGSFLKDVDLKKALEEPHQIFERLTAIINTDMDFYGYLFSMRKNVSLVSKVTAMMKEKTKQAVIEQIEIEEQLADVVLEYAITGMISVYQLWFLSERRDSIETISDIISLMSIQGITGVLERYGQKQT